MNISKRKAFEDVGTNQRDVRQKVTNQRTSPKSTTNSVWYDERTKFKQILAKFGFKLSATDDQNSVLSIESVKFIKSLTNDLKSGLESCGTDFLDEFYDGFMRYIRVKDRLRFALMPTQLVLDEAEPGAEVVTEDSLIRLLLKIDALQVRIASEVLQKLSEILKLPNSSDMVFAKLIINQFRFLEHVVDSEVMCEKFFELIKLSKGEIQLELLACLPELADDNQHESLAANLSDFMKNAKDLVVPILNTIGNLSFRSELLLEIRNAAVTMLNELNLKDIPIVMKFLFGTVSNVSDSEKLFNEISANLDFLRVLNSNIGVDATFISVLETFLKYQKHILDGSVRYLDSISSHVDVKVMDFVVLLILLNTAKKKTAITFIKQMIRSGALNDDLLEKSCTNVVILKRYFKLIFELCETLARSFEPSINSFGCSLYRLCFSQLDDFYRQEIVGALVTHVGSGCDSECSSALTTLDLLINLYPKDLCQFSIFLKNMLEFLPFLKFEQVRSVYSLLGKLASVDDSETGCILDELNIIIRKNIAGGSLRQRANGVLCAVMLFQNLLKKSDKQQIALEIIEFAETSTSDCSFTQSLLYDELSFVIKSCEIDSVVLKKFKADVADLFETVYICKDSREIKKYKDDEAIILGLNDDDNFAIRISPLSFKKTKNQKENDKSTPSLTLAPTFRLLSTCEILISNNLTVFDEIFDSPMIFLKKSMVDDFETETKENKELLCRTVFHAVNWLRELLNAFSQVDDDENVQRLVERLRHVVRLQKELENCLKKVPSFAVPIAGYYESDKMPIVKTISSQKQPTAAKTKPEKGRVMRKKKVDVPEKQTQMSSTVLNTSNDGLMDSISPKSISPKPGPSKKASPSASSVDASSSIQPYYRELEFTVFTLLNRNLALNSTSQDVDGNLLLCDDLMFLLDDLNDKLKYRLPTSIKRSCGFLKVQSQNNFRFQRLATLDEMAVFSRATKYIPALLRHLDSCKNYFKAIVDENDGVVDCPVMWSRQSLHVSNCFDSIVDCLNTILCWRGHGLSSNKEATKYMFKHFSNSFSSGKGNVSTVNIVANQAINHLLNFVDVVTNLSSATNFLSLLSTFSQFGASSESKQKISEIAVSCLKREWTSPEGSSLKGAKVNAAIKSLLRIASTNTDEKLLKFVENLIQSALSEATVNDNFCSETYKTLNKTTFGSWYDSLFAELINASKMIENLSDSNSTESVENNLLLWIQASRQFNFMTSVLKKIETRSVFVSALQHGKNFVQCFVQNCMNLLDHSFAESYEDVRRLLSLMQTGTRLLQTLCIHSKIITKDKTLTKYVPPLKKTLEEFVYRVKAMMAMNNCETALSIAVLKTKNFQGEVMLSQRTVQDSEDVEEPDNGDLIENEDETVVPDSEREEEGDDDEEVSNDHRENDIDDDDDQVADYSESY